MSACSRSRSSSGPSCRSATTPRAPDAPFSCPPPARAHDTRDQPPAEVHRRGPRGLGRSGVPAARRAGGRSGARGGERARALGARRPGRTGDLARARARLRGQGVELSDAELAGIVAELTELGVVEDAGADRRLLSGSELERFDRQLRYFGDVAGRPRGPRSRRPCATRHRGRPGAGRAGRHGRDSAGPLRGWAAHRGRRRRGGAVQPLAPAAYDEGDVGAGKVAVAGRRLRPPIAACASRAASSSCAAPRTWRARSSGADFVVAASDWPVGR